MTEERKNDTQPEEKEPERIPWSEFLESYPLNTLKQVSGYSERSEGYSPFVRIAPTIRLYCIKCEGIRNFSGIWVHESSFHDMTIVRDFLQYTCKDCEKGEKTFCVISGATDDAGNGIAFKIGEIPEIHVELPRSLKPLLGDDDYMLFIKGLTCEKKGLGIGAFTYYRRVVESQKSHLIAEILRVAEKLDASKAVQDVLKRAESEKQFARAVDMIKDVIPESLLVNAHNPLKLLHNALSIGVHVETDDNCLRIARDIRLVLADLAERLKLALQDQAELRTAVAGLLKFNADAKKTSKGSQPEN